MSNDDVDATRRDDVDDGGCHESSHERVGDLDVLRDVHHDIRGHDDSLKIWYKI